MDKFVFSCFSGTLPVCEIQYKGLKNDQGCVILQEPVICQCINGVDLPILQLKIYVVTVFY